MAKIQIVENNFERQKVLKVAFQEEGNKVSLPSNLSSAWTEIMNINLRPELIIISLENNKHKFILRLLAKSFPNLPAIILYRIRNQYQDLDLQENWHLFKMPFNPMSLAKWAGKILTRVH
ncbi:MAG: hypothetical protein U5L76_05110 [Patescibacteria group bacterium]|nr:hypothetical protein [Patescibacteria group bacterium]